MSSNNPYISEELLKTIKRITQSIQPSIDIANSIKIPMAPALKVNEDILKMIDFSVKPILERQIKLEQSLSKSIQPAIAQMDYIKKFMEDIKPNINLMYSDILEIPNFPNILDTYSEDDFSELVDEIDAIETISLTDEKRKDISKAIEPIAEDFYYSFEITNAESNKINQQHEWKDSNRSNETDNYQNVMYDFFQEVKSSLSSKKFHADDIATRIMDLFYGALYALVGYLVKGYIDPISFIIAIGILLRTSSIFKNDD